MPLQSILSRQGAGLCLLSLDGGGPRGISQLKILAELMDRLNFPIKSGQIDSPCDVFDMIGGAGSGGFIAILLVIFGLTAKQALDEFIELSVTVFATEGVDGPGRIKALKGFIANLLNKYGIDVDMRIMDPNDHSERCKLVVPISYKHHIGLTGTLRNFDDTPEQTLNLTVAESLQVTLATPTLFPSGSISEGDTTFEYISADLMHSNPTRNIVSEAYGAFVSGERIACLLSLGCGHLDPIVAPGDFSFTLWGKSLEELVTDREREAMGIERQLGHLGLYHRYSVVRGAGYPDLSRNPSPGDIIGHTMGYLADTAVSNKLYMGIDSLMDRDGIISLGQLKHTCDGNPLKIPDPINVTLTGAASSSNSSLLISSPGSDDTAHELHDQRNMPAQDAEEEDSHNLETLMTIRKPLDLTGHVVIPDYQFQAHGGLAVVYRGLSGDTTVAVKVLKFRRYGKAGATWDESNERRVRREINVWAALKHRNIIQFLGYSAGFSDFPAMISPWCQTGSASEYLERQEPTPHKRVILDVTEGIQYLHQLKVVHGDVKPANILINDEGVAKLCDFGLVRLADWEGPAGMTTTSPYTGTELYKAPELFVSPENRWPVATFEGDIYSLGSIMLEFIERVYPFQRFTNGRELRTAILDGYTPALRSETTHALLNMTEFLWNLLEACWGAPSARPSIGIALDALETYARYYDPPRVYPERSSSPSWKHSKNPAH